MFADTVLLEGRITVLVLSRMVRQEFCSCTKASWLATAKNKRVRSQSLSELSDELRSAKV